MTRKSIKKQIQKKTYKNHLTKINDNGFRHYHCFTCFDNDKMLVEGEYISGEWICNKCNGKWIIVA